jgi:HEPN domain-containing protein
MYHEPRHIFATAERFLDASNVLLEASHTKNLHQGLAVPQTVCSAFCLELYLKCIITIETKSTPRGHDLVDLYSMLSNTSKQEIISYFDKNSAINKENYLAFCKHVGKEPENFDFNFALTLSKRAFEDIRYIHEQKEGQSGWCAQPIRDGAKKVIQRLQPDWFTSS